MEEEAIDYRVYEVLYCEVKCEHSWEEFDMTACGLKSLTIKVIWRLYGVFFHLTKFYVSCLTSQRKTGKCLLSFNKIRGKKQ